MIAEHDYVVGGNDWSHIITTVGKQKYENELVNPATADVEHAKIGLMYVSDYGYAAYPSYWTTVMYREDGQDYRLAATSNWMYMGLHEWTILRNSSNINNLFHVNMVGYVYNYNVSSDFRAVRPVFYLASTVNYAGGNGTVVNPIRIS